MSAVDRLIDLRVAGDFTSIDRNLGSEIVSLVLVDYKNITQKVSAITRKWFTH